MKNQTNQRNKMVGRNKDLNRRFEIYRKALDLFIKRGYHGTSMSLISKALRMSKANLYHYCSSKEDFFYQIHLHYLQQYFIPFVEQAESLPDPKDRITLVLRRLTLLNATDEVTRVLVPDIVNLNKSHHGEIISIWKRAYDVVCNSIKELQRSGKAVKLRASFQAHVAFGMSNWIVFWFDYGRQGNAEELAETVVQTFLNGLLGPTAEKRRD